MHTPTRIVGRQPIALSNDSLRRLVPSVFAATPWHSMSDRYKFVPTIEVVDVLRDRGFVPTFAVQSRSRIEGKGDFTKHLLRFRQENLLAPTAVGDEFPELVLVNSHDGTSSYNFMSGIFRLVCGNGLVVQSSDLGSVKVHHKGGSDFHDQVIDATFEVMDSAPRTLESIKTWKQLALPAPVQRAFATAVKELVPDKPVTEAQILSPRRREDQAGNLWTTTNVIQENLICGGIRSRSETGRKTRTREIKGVSENVRLNQAIWKLTEEMARLMGA